MFANGNQLGELGTFIRTITNFIKEFKKYKNIHPGAPSVIMKNYITVGVLDMDRVSFLAKMLMEQWD